MDVDQHAVTTGIRRDILRALVEDIFHFLEHCPQGKLTINKKGNTVKVEILNYRDYNSAEF